MSCNYLEKTRKRCRSLEKLYADIRHLTEQNSLLGHCSHYTFELFKWAWSVFMTRSVFLDGNKGSRMSLVLINVDIDTSSIKVSKKFRKKNTYALAPFLGKYA